MLGCTSRFLLTLSLTQNIEAYDLDGLVGRGDLALVGPRVDHFGVLDPQRPPVGPGHVDGLDARVFRVSQLVQAQHVEVANPHPRHLRAEKKLAT